MFKKHAAVGAPNVGQAIAYSEDARREPFGFVCSRCSHCCYSKRIQVNPYEIARLARNRKMSSAEFRARHTLDGGGNYLRQRDDGSCEFLGAQGCEVHPDRPLVCRVYPLGRHVSSEGSERFSHLEPHPLSGGQFHRQGTVGDYLSAQGAEPFMHAADAYFFWLCRAQESLSHLDRASGDLPGAPELFDMDAAIAWHCARRGETEPCALEERLDLHLRILNEVLSNQRGDLP